jgi:hypothetical protein
MAEAIRMSLARCGEEFSIGELAAVLLQFASEIRLFEYCTIDDAAWDSPVLNVEHSLDIGCAVSGEALIDQQVREASRRRCRARKEDRPDRSVPGRTSRAAPAIRPLARTSVSAFDRRLVRAQY